MSKSLIFYIDNDWNNIVKEFKLQENLEIVINHEQNTSNDKIFKSHHWLLRAFLITSIIGLFGNLPVQTHFVSALPTIQLTSQNKSTISVTPAEQKEVTVNNSSSLTINDAVIDNETETDITTVDKGSFVVDSSMESHPNIGINNIDDDAQTEILATSEEYPHINLAPPLFNESSNNNSNASLLAPTTNAEGALALNKQEQPQIDIIEAFTLPARAIETYAGHNAKESNGKWRTYRVKSYDNLTNIFYKVGHQKLLKTLKKNKAISKELNKLKSGTLVRASADRTKPFEFIFSNDNINSYVLTQKNKNEYSGKWVKNIFEVRQSRASFTIRNGLFFDGRKAGIATQIIKQVVKVFDWDIDFSHDVRVGDKVTAVFEEVYHDGDKIGNQNLLAAEFINKGREFRAVRYTYKDGKADYFTPEGREMKKAFIRTPISHARISSHFNPGRYHPVLHKMRVHKGTDFAARRGTPIMASGNGIIKSLGRKGGYGRAIVISHREGYKTLYAHMSKYNKKLKVGDKVYQGDIIGYVGSSGLATGPHLHYEFLIGGKAVDPMKVKLPHSLSLSSSELQDFRNKAINLVLQLNVLNRFVKAEIEINSAFGG